MIISETVVKARSKSTSKQDAYNDTTVVNAGN